MNRFLIFFLFLPLFSISANNGIKNLAHEIQSRVHTSSNSYKWNYVSAGLIGSILNIKFFGVANASCIESKDFKSFKKLYLEVGGLVKFLPFCGVQISCISNEFFNDTLKNNHVISGFKVGGFLHYSFLLIEFGVMIKEGSKNIMKFDYSNRSYGVSIYIGAKFIKDSFIFGGGVLLP